MLLLLLLLLLFPLLLLTVRCIGWLRKHKLGCCSSSCSSLLLQLLTLYSVEVYAMVGTLSDRGTHCFGSGMLYSYASNVLHPLDLKWEDPEKN